MAQFSTTISGFQGSEGVDLPVSVGVHPKTLAFGSPLVIGFTVENVLPRVVTFPNVSVAVVGTDPVKAKVTASLLETAMTLQAGETVSGQITVEASEALSEGETFALVLDSGAEA